jgi:hypothetical protein
MWSKNYRLQNIQLSKILRLTVMPFYQHRFDCPSHRDEGDRELYGGEYRDRTGDLLVANQALSQLS